MSFTFSKNKNNNPASQPGKEQSKRKGFIESLNRGLAKTHEILTIRIDDLILGKKEIDHYFIEELEEILISSDLGVKTSHKLIEQVQAKVKRGEEIGRAHV